jgi:hypothetical protein
MIKKEASIEKKGKIMEIRRKEGGRKEERNKQRGEELIAGKKSFGKNRQ